MHWVPNSIVTLALILAVRYLSFLLGLYLMPIFSRRNFLTTTACTAVALTTGSFTILEAAQGQTPSAAPAKEPSDASLDQFVENYMKAMNSPGLTLGTANRKGTVRVVSYGFSNPAMKQPVEPSQLFHIGSITKSFVALVLLQLHEEGKLDLHKPVLDYLPWLPIVTSYGQVSAHDLLTHTAGLPDALSLIPSDRATRYVQAWKPGERFYYSNLGFDILGNLIEALDGRTWAASVKVRVLDRVGMHATAPVITNDIRERTAESWVPYFEDRPYPRYGRLGPAANLQFDDAAGCIASTPGDMTLYMQMLLNRGQAPGGQIVSAESFELMSKPWIKARDFGPAASYGYGIGVDSLDGHTILRHTGGMPSFMSAINLDLDAGFGAFASINAQQEYRPAPVAQYAVQLMGAAVADKPAPPSPAIEDPRTVKNSSDYVGTYASPDGKSIEFTGDGALLANMEGKRIALQHSGSDSFIASDATLARSPFVFGRAKKDKPDDKPGAVVELMHGRDWYTNARYSGPRNFPVPPEYAALTGTYRGIGAFEGERANIVVLKGELWVEGESSLERIGEYEFRPTKNAPNPERVEFLFIVNGKARLLKFSGADFFRFEVA
jgi:CubicO group peptidase (beta-lactamase class C family)